MSPKLPAWQLGLRFLLELLALVGAGRGTQVLAVHVLAALAPNLLVPISWLATFLIPALLAAAWGTFAVPGDSSRSGRAPIAIPGAVRLLLEVSVFALGALGYLLAGDRIALALDLVLLIVHHAGTTSRLGWLVRQ